jgi:hypothetical protein
MVFYRYQNDDGAWVVTANRSAIPADRRAEAEAIVLPDFPSDQADRAEAEPSEPGLIGGERFDVSAWVQTAREAAPIRPLPRLGRWDWPSAGIGFGLGLTVFVVYAFLSKSGRLFTRLALFALVILLMGTSVAGWWIAPHVPGAPEWLMTPDELIREARRVADEAAPEKRLGDLK